MEVCFMDHEMQAAQLFLDGYNCAQAITVAFSDVTGLDKDFSARMASSFGGGMGRMREVCGAVSGMLMVAGILYGYDTNGDDTAKKAHYTLVQALAGQFREEVGSIVCREILKNPPTDPNPTPRTEEFYKQRPCSRMVMVAARILDTYIREHPIEKGA
jgi:C_GCAxxG_C_C family probable redox protein